MTAEERKNAYARLLRECPEILTPRMVARWTRQSKNTVYAEILTDISVLDMDFTLEIEHPFSPVQKAE